MLPLGKGMKRNKFFPFSVAPIPKETGVLESKTEGTKVVSLVKHVKNYQVYPFTLNILVIYIIITVK